MERDAEADPDRVRPVDSRPGPIGGAVLLNEVEDLVRALVRALRPARARQQPGQPRRRERRLRDVERLAAHAKGGRDLSDGALVEPMSTEHLVLHLDAIASVEKVVAAERRIVHHVGARMQRPGCAERRDLGILCGGRTAARHRVNHNTSI